MITGLMRFVQRAEEARRALERVPADIPRPDLGSMLRELSQSVRQQHADEWVPKLTDAVGEVIVRAAKKGETSVKLREEHGFYRVWSEMHSSGVSRESIREAMEEVAQTFRARGVRIKHDSNYVQGDFWTASW
jgi:hypothetical protein